mgnify:CR=1 FL=1
MPSGALRRRRAQSAHSRRNRSETATTTSTTNTTTNTTIVITTTTTIVTSTTTIATSTMYIPQYCIVLSYCCTVLNYTVYQNSSNCYYNIWICIDFVTIVLLYRCIYSGVMLLRRCEFVRTRRLTRAVCLVTAQIAVKHSRRRLPHYHIVVQNTVVSMPSLLQLPSQRSAIHYGSGHYCLK